MHCCISSSDGDSDTKGGMSCTSTSKNGFDAFMMLVPFLEPMRFFSVFIEFFAE